MVPGVGKDHNIYMFYIENNLFFQNQRANFNQISYKSSLGEEN
jgi:hypothetical protein